MIELLIVIALATIGIHFTTTTPESMERTHVDDDQYDDESHEDEGGIGILGIDIGRKMKHVRKARIAARERVAMLRRPAETAPDPAPVVSEADTDAAIRSVLTGAEWEEGGADTAPVGPESYDEDEEIADPLPPLVARAEVAEPVVEEDALPEEIDDLAEAESEHEPADAFEFVAMATPEPVSVAKPDPGEEDDDSAFNAAISAAIRAEFEEQEADRVAATRAPQGRAMDRSGPPVIEEFDPDEDQIVIGYRAEEAGDGRIGITEDPTWPGTARVTLGGKVVALVPGGYGLVQAYHIELRLLHNAA